jgi:large subunit ribosomal protein L27
MAHKKGVGSSKNGRDSNSQRRGAKEPDGKLVTGGSIIFRQVGNRWYPGKNAGQGSDFTIYARVPGIVKFERKKSGKKYIHILPVEAPAGE